MTHCGTFNLSWLAGGGQETSHTRVRGAQDSYNTNVLHTHTATNALQRSVKTLIFMRSPGSAI